MAEKPPVSKKNEAPVGGTENIIRNPTNSARLGLAGCHPENSPEKVEKQIFKQEKSQ